MDYAMPATVIGTKGSAVKVGDVENLSIERADNGFTLHINYKQPPPKKGVERDWNAGREVEVYNKLDDLLARVRKAFEGAKLEGAGKKK